MKIKFIKNIIDKIKGNKNNDNKKYYIKSFSQSGEDAIVNFILTICLNLKDIKYLDVGANHSSWISNTKYFYDKGFSGVLIEPDPTLYEEIKLNRPNDICLNCGVGITNQKEADFYILNTPTLNTFSKKEAEVYVKENGYKIVKTAKIELVNINEIFNKYFENGLDFLSLDIEGLDFKVLKSIDYNKNRPKVICVESLTYDNDRSKQKKETEIIEYLKQQNYFVYADTFINTIFVDKGIW